MLKSMVASADVTVSVVKTAHPKENVMTVTIELTADEISFIKDIVSEAHDGYSNATGKLDGAEEVVVACDKVLKALENGVPDDNT